MPPADGQVPIFLSATDYDLPEPLPQGLAKYSNFRDLARGVRPCCAPVSNESPAGRS